MGGIPPLGYDVVDRKLVVNPAEAELVRLIFRRFLDLGSALLLIRELNAQGHHTKSWRTKAGTFREGRPFDKGTLYKILRNRTWGTLFSLTPIWRGASLQNSDITQGQLNGAFTDEKTRVPPGLKTKVALSEQQADHKAGEKANEEGAS